MSWAAVWGRECVPLRKLLWARSRTRYQQDSGSCRAISKTSRQEARVINSSVQSSVHDDGFGPWICYHDHNSIFGSHIVRTQTLYITITLHKYRYCWGTDVSLFLPSLQP